MNKRGYTSPYQEFCKDQRSLVAQLGLRGSDREKLLGVTAITRALDLTFVLALWLAVEP